MYFKNIQVKRVLKKEFCRLCKSDKVESFLDLGFAPISDQILTKNQLLEKEETYPLVVDFCENCGLSQLNYVVPPELMYNENYSYDSSSTKSFRNHCLAMVEDFTKKYVFQPNSNVIDVGCNAGLLLSGFREKGFKVIGIEPSVNVAKIAKEKGIQVYEEFFSKKLAHEIVKTHGKISIITGTNVFAHIDDLDEFFDAVKILLTNDGIIVIEAPNMFSLIGNLEYDTIYHEHLSYLSLKPIVKFCKNFEIEVFDVEFNSIHGGTYRYFFGKIGTRKISENVNKFIKLEEEKRIFEKNRLLEFAEDVKKHKIELNTLLWSLKKDGKKIVGISAPAKGNALTNYCKIGTDLLDYITEVNPLKIGKFTPGMHIPIVSEDRLLEDKPDYGLILAWNFADSIISNNQKFRENGGKFIIPIPHPIIV